MGSADSFIRQGRFCFVFFSLVGWLYPPLIFVCIPPSPAFYFSRLSRPKHLLPSSLKAKVSKLSVLVLPDRAPRSVRP